MEKSSVVYYRIDNSLKDKAESVLAKLGVTPAAAIAMFYSQIVLRGGIPFDVRLPAGISPVSCSLPQAGLDTELEKGINSLTTGRTYTVSEADRELDKEPDHEL